ncbi:oligosaccharide flippase family protein [bacterium]|nr:oligosaccharide flippase family protein [bacterium]
MKFAEDQYIDKEQLNAIFKDIVKYSPSKLCGMLGNALIVPVYTHLLLPEQYGLYSLSIAFLSFLCIIFSDWVGLSGLRFFRSFQLADELPKYLSMLVSILTFNICAMFLIAFLFRHEFYDFFNIQPKYFFCILVLIIPVAIRALLFQLLRAQLKSVSFTFSTILNQIMTMGLSVLIIKFFNLGALSLLLGMGISITLTDLLLIYQSGILRYFRKPNLSWNILLPMFQYGVPIAATSLSAWVINQSNKFIMNSISGFKEVGLVGVAYGLTLPLLMTIFSIITVAVVPRIFNMFEDKIDVRPIITRFTGYFLVVSIPLITVVSIYAYDFVSMLSSPKFQDAYRLIPYFSFGCFFMALSDYTTLPYHLANKTYIDFILKLISGVVGIAANIILIPKMGLEGAGIATLGANFVYFFLSVIIRIRGLEFHCPFRAILRMGISFVPMVLLYYQFKNIAFVPALIQMILLLGVFYFVYWILSRTILKRPAL